MQFFYSYKIYNDSLTAFTGTFTLAFLCFSIQSVRNDKGFIYLHSESYHFSLYTEYFLLTLPFTVLCLFTTQWYCFLLLQAILFLVPYNKFTIRQRTFFKNISALIPSSNFEWISGFRKSFALIIPVYLLALGFCWLKIVPLFLLFFLTMLIISFYNECESLLILHAGNDALKNFLFKKLLSHSVYLIILYLPVLIINAIFNKNFLILNFLFLLSQISVLLFAICFKYCNYEPNKLQFGNNIIVMLVSACAAVPVLLPVPVAVAAKYYFRAKENLKQYFL